MDLQKIIDNTDFDNLKQLTKRWKKESQLQINSESLKDSKLSSISSFAQQKSNVFKQNVQKQSNKEKIINQINNNEINYKKKPSFIPQVIDQDTQHFKNKLQHLLNTFKTDAVSQFMSMKRQMIDYQKETIKNDTEKYLIMYEEKHQELIIAKQRIANLTNDVEKKTMQLELMSNHISKLNERVKITRYLSRPFALLYENKCEQKMLKLKMKQAGKRSDRSTIIKGFNGWRNILREAKNERQQIANNKKIQMQVSEIVSRYQKQIQQLKQRLGQALSKNQQYQNNKYQIHQNLKKAFLRGMSSMNMEAMGILGNSNLDLSQRKVQYDPPIKNQSFVQSSNLTYSRNMPAQTSNQSLPNTSVVINKAKIESKDHKWKQAPILGMEQKQQHEQPRTQPQFVKPTTQGKVIKIIDGRSSVDCSGVKQIKKPTNMSSMVTNKFQNSTKRKP